MPKALSPNLSLFVKDFSSDNIINTELSIKLSLNGFSFLIYDNQKSEILGFESSNFKDEGLGNKNLDDLKQLFESHPLIKEYKSNVRIQLQNGYSILCPEEFYEQNKIVDYLSAIHQIEKTDQIISDSLAFFKTKNVWAVKNSVYDLLLNYFPQAILVHHSTVFINGIDKDTMDKKIAFMQVSGNSMDIVIFHQKNIKFYNSFKFKSPEDLVYYLVGTYKNNDLDPNSSPLIIHGELFEDSAVYRLIYKYIREVSFYKSSGIKFNIEHEQAIPLHFFTSYLNLLKCE